MINSSIHTIDGERNYIEIDFFAHYPIRLAPVITGFSVLPNPLKS
jgi:hypothetical protein